jgi:hypothetical protein
LPKRFQLFVTQGCAGGHAVDPTSTKKESLSLFFTEATADANRSSTDPMSKHIHSNDALHEER